MILLRHGHQDVHFMEQSTGAGSASSGSSSVFRPGSVSKGNIAGIVVGIECIDLVALIICCCRCDHGQKEPNYARQVSI